MTDHAERDYLERTIATVRNHRGAENCWPQWANIFADEIERCWDALAALERERDEWKADFERRANLADRRGFALAALRARHTELATCVLHGWTSPAFGRGRLQTRAIELARAALACSVRDEEEPCEFCGDGPCPHGCEEQAVWNEGDKVLSRADLFREIRRATRRQDALMVRMYCDLLTEHDKAGAPATPDAREATHSVQADVEAFHHALDIPVGDSPAIRRPELRAEMIREEARETVEAIEAGDLVGAIDGLCDLLCVTYGAAAEFGIDLAPFWNEVHRTNMAKVGGPVREDGKRLKPPGWKPPDIAGLLRVCEADAPASSSSGGGGE